MRCVFASLTGASIMADNHYRIFRKGKEIYTVLNCIAAETIVKSLKEYYPDETVTMRCVFTLPEDGLHTHYQEHKHSAWSKVVSMDIKDFMFDVWTEMTGDTSDICTRFKNEPILHALG